MADTRAATGLTVQQWDDNFFVEYLAQNRYAGEMGTAENDIIQVKEDLTKKPGDSVTFALVNKLTQDATTGSAMLEGNEEDMTSRSYRLYVDKRRNAVRIPEMEEQRSAIDLREAARYVLKDWAMKDTETLITRALGRCGGVEMTAAAFGSAGNQTALDAWLVDNADRVYFGNNAYTAMTDLSAGLALLTAATAAERLTAANISAMKFLAKTRANPKIRPIRTENSTGREYYVMYAHPLAFRDLRADTTITQAQREVSLEMENNRLFRGGDILWDNVIVKEVSDMFDLNTLTNLGDSSTTTVVPAFLCGAQAVGVAYAKRWRTRTEEFDYGDKYGVAIDGIYGVGKMLFGSGLSDTDDLKDHGVVTGFFAASSAT